MRGENNQIFRTKVNNDFLENYILFLFRRSVIKGPCLNSVPRRTFTIRDWDRFLRPVEAAAGGVEDVIVEDVVGPGNDMKSVKTLDIDGRQLLKLFKSECYSNFAYSCNKITKK